MMINNELWQLAGLKEVWGPDNQLSYSADFKNAFLPLCKRMKGPDQCGWYSSFCCKVILSMMLILDNLWMLQSQQVFFRDWCRPKQVTEFYNYRIPANSFRGNYSFLNLEIVENSNSCRKFQIFYPINRIFAVETIQGSKLFQDENYSRIFN